MTIGSRSKRILAIVLLVFLWFSVHSLLWVVYGYQNLFDANGYIQGADFILNNGKLEDIHHLFYITHIGVIMFFRWLFPDSIYFIIIFQCILSGIGIILLYKASIRIFNSHLAAFLSGIIFLCWWDIIQFNITLLTESLACSLMCFLVYILSDFSGKVKDYIWTFVLLLLSLFTRPTGVILIIGTVFFLLSYYWKDTKRIKGLNWALVAATIIFGVIAADQMFLHWDFTEEWVQGNIVTYMNKWEGTNLYYSSLRLDPRGVIFPPEEARPLIKMLIFIYDNPIFFVKAGFLKVWYFLSCVRPYYTLTHNIFSIVWILFVNTAFCLGWMKMKTDTIKIFVFTIIGVNCLLIFISSVDWNNRFYVSMVPVIVLVAGRGAAFFFQIFQKSQTYRTVKECIFTKQFHNR